MGEHDGHRKRLMQKVKTTILPDHEYLEAFLFNALPRRNTNDLAHRLLAEFGSLEQVFSADVDSLQKVDGIGKAVAEYLVLAGKLMPRLYGEMQKPYIPEKYKHESFLPYVKANYKYLTKEVIDVYLLDGQGRIMLKRRFGSDNYYRAEMHPEDVGKLLAEFSPAGIVLVHNHPYGEATVSEMDEYTTSYVQLICSTQNVMFCDHIVYAPNGVYSYYLSGELKKIAEKYSIQGMLGNAPVKD